MGRRGEEGEERRRGEERGDPTEFKEQHSWEKAIRGRQSGPEALVPDTQL